MRKIYTLALFCFLSFSMFANELHYQELAPLYEHMVHVNKEWKTQKELPVELLDLSIKFDSDDDRIQTHLRLVSHILQQRDHNLSEVTLAKRKKNLESLVSYWQEGTFPINTNHVHRQPYFIDAVGTACAVGHLLQTSGEEDLAQQISDEQNYAYIRELAYPQLGQWARTNGFTQDELAWIQPTYSSTECLEYATPPIGWPGNSSTSEVRVMKQTNFGLVIGGEFTLNTPTGTAYSLVYHNFVEYVPFPVQIVGKVFDIAVEGNDLYVVGDFEIPGTNFKNVIKVNSTGWEGLQSGSMVGTPKSVRVYDCNVYIGGTFSKVEGNSQSFFAAWSINDQVWTLQPRTCSGVQYPDVITVNHIVYDLEVHNGRLIVGGKFSQAGSNTSTPQGMSFYSSTGWNTPPSSNFSSVKHLVLFNNKLLVGTNRISYYDYVSWRPGADALPTGTYCHEFDKIDNFTSLFTIGTAPNQLLVSSVGNKTEILNKNSFYSNDNLLNVTPSTGSFYAGVAMGPDIYLGGKFSNGMSIESEDGCYFAIPCTINTISAEGAIMTFDKVLPLELNEFSATLEEATNHVELNWETLSEEGIDKFIIERSIEPGGAGFAAIGEVMAVGESTNSVFYDYEDDVARLVAPNIYYRLKIIEVNGTIKYSEIEVVQQKSPDRPTFRLFPNPSNGSVTLNINGSDENQISLSVFDVQGKLHHQEDVALEDSFISQQFDFNHLSQGLYIIQVKNSRASYVIKMEIL